MKKIFILALCLMLCSNSLYALMTFHRTKAIEGIITDKKTGKPIENVIVHAEWHEMRPALIHAAYGTAEAKTVLTDKNGRFYMPANITFHFMGLIIVGGSFFDGMTIAVHHPLYERISQRSIHSGSFNSGYRIHTKELAHLKEINGKVEIAIKLFPLSEKFLSKPWDVSGTIFQSYRRHFLEDELTTIEGRFPYYLGICYENNRKVDFSQFELYLDTVSSTIKNWENPETLWRLWEEDVSKKDVWVVYKNNYNVKRYKENIYKEKYFLLIENIRKSLREYQNISKKEILNMLSAKKDTLSFDAFINGE